MTNEEIETIVALCVERVLLAIPVVINQVLKMSSSLHNLSEQFYNDNKDLLPHKALVAHVLEQIEIANPGKSLETLMPLVASTTRQQLRTVEHVSRISEPAKLAKLDANLGAL